MRSFNPKTVAGPFASYSHGVEVPATGRLLFGAGQAGVDTDGRIGVDIEEQARLVWQNISEVLAGAQMTVANIVQLDMLLVSRDDYAQARAVRDESLGAHRPASTLMYVSGLANQAWLIEIDFVAWAPEGGSRA